MAILALLFECEEAKSPVDTAQMVLVFVVGRNQGIITVGKAVILTLGQLLLNFCYDVCLPLYLFEILSVLCFFYSFTIFFYGFQNRRV